MKFFRHSFVAAFLAMALVFTGSTSAFSAGFKAKFIAACKADGDTVKACECRYKSLKKPKSKDEEKLVLAMLKSNEAEVDRLIKKSKNLRNATIINSMTRGLMVCLNA